MEDSNQYNATFLAKNDYKEDLPTQLNYAQQGGFLQEKPTKVDNSSLLQSLIEQSSFDQLIQFSEPVDVDSINVCSALLWEKYLDSVRCDEACLKALESKAIQDGESTLRFSLDIKGDRPVEGYSLYIALHGGGSCPSDLNDSQWEHMKIYYLECVKTGIYVATRGISDNWNLHFEDASYRLYDKLIKMLVALHNVDPNRVYLLGFSAGGDGVYQVVPRMPDLWAAANMSAGHSNGIRFDNLYQIPFLMQMGEKDRAYNRHKVAVDNYRELTRLNQLRGGGYVRELFVHKGKGHNGWYDHDPHERSHPVMVKNEHMLTSDQTYETCNTSAVTWISKHKRNPYPTKIFWDPNTNAPRHVKHGAAYLYEDSSKLCLVESRHQCYWLNLGHTPEISDSFVIEAEIEKDSNLVKLNTLGTLSYISILLNPNMLNLSEPVNILVDGKYVGSIQVMLDLRIMTRTLLERGDLHYIFTSEIVLVKNIDHAWQILNN